jgi:hypothetical protein
VLSEAVCVNRTKKKKEEEECGRNKNKHLRTVWIGSKRREQVRNWLLKKGKRF